MCCRHTLKRTCLLLTGRERHSDLLRAQWLQSMVKFPSRIPALRKHSQAHPLYPNMRSPESKPWCGYAFADATPQVMTRKNCGNAEARALDNNFFLSWRFITIMTH